MWAFRAATRVGVSRVRWNSVSRVFMCMTHTSVAIPCVSRSLDDLAGSIADARAAADAREHTPEHPFYTCAEPCGAIPKAFYLLYGERCAVQPPSVTYLREASEMDTQLRSALAAPGTVGRTIGLDLEWNVGLAPGRTAVMQIATATRIFVLHVSHLRALPDAIAQLLVDKTIPKVGVAVRQDLAKLSRDFGLEPRGALELSRIARRVDVGRWKARRWPLISLRNLSSTYLMRDLRKDSTRMSTWTVAPLSEEQLAYAANDAYVALEILHELVCLAHTQVIQTSPQVAREAVLNMLSEATQTEPYVRRESRPSVPNRNRAHHRALDAWRQGLSMCAIAKQADIALLTVAGYVARALSELPQVSEAERQRLRKEFSHIAVRPVAIRYGLLLARLGIFRFAEVRRWIARP